MGAFIAGVVRVACFYPLRYDEDLHQIQFLFFCGAKQCGYSYMDLNGKRILVTGGAGFIGSATITALRTAGALVTVIDNLSTGVRDHLPGDVPLHELNITDPHVAGVFTEFRPEIVYHFAFNVLVPKSVDDPLLEADGIVGSLRIIDQCRRHGVGRIIFASSGFIYGNNPNLPLRETELFQAVSPYAIAKYTVEQYLQFFRHAFGLPYIILRYATVYGPGQISGAMADYSRKLHAGEQAEIWGDGTKTRDYVYIDDVVRANYLALTVPANHPDPVFNIGTGKQTTLNELYRHIAKAIGCEPQPIYRRDRVGEQNRYALDSAKAYTTFGWRAEVDVVAGLHRVFESVRDMPISHNVCTLRS